MLESHEQQIDDKRHALEVQREDEAVQHYDSLQVSVSPSPNPKPQP